MFKRISLVLLGQVLIGIGASFLLMSNIGVDPNSVFITGICAKTGQTYGTISAIVNALIVASLFFIDKNYVHFSSVSAIFIVGVVVDLSYKIIGSMIIPLLTNLPLAIINLLIGLIIICCGVVMYVSQGLGIAAFDAVPELITNRFKLDYKKIRIGFDILMLVLGIILGGNIGIGTAIAALLAGPLINIIRSIFKVKNYEEVHGTI